MAKAKKIDERDQQIAELTADLQRMRADFENYRKRMDAEKSSARENGKASAVIQLLPAIDTIDRAIRHMPAELADNKWAMGIAAISKNLDKTLESLNLSRIAATPGTIFNPEFHEAVQFDEDSEGEHEVVAEELQSGYLLGGQPIRHAMVKVTRQ